METLNPKNIISQARQRLMGRNTKNLTMLYAGVSAAVSLVIVVLQLLLAKGIGNTGGLSGMATRSLLETGQLVLEWANVLLLPFWNLGFLYLSLLWARGEATNQRDLLTGFRRFGPYLGLTLNRLLLTIAVMILCMNVSSILFMLTPASAGIMELMGSYSNTEELYSYLYTLDTAQLTGMLRSMVPSMIFCFLLGGALLIPLLYRFRMAEFVILDEPRARGLSSMILSGAMMRRHRWELFRLDLRFWWYYGLKCLCALLLYADALLAIVGVALPVTGDTAYLLACCLYMVGIFGVEVAFRPLVQTAYACAFEKLKAMSPMQMPAMPPKNQNTPWNEE